MAVDRPASYYFENGTASPGTPRRNSLSDLRIPTRITSSQARIEEDLERVKQFAKGIDGQPFPFPEREGRRSDHYTIMTDLKALQKQYYQLIQIVISPPSSPSPSPSPSDDVADEDGPSATAVNKIAQAIKRIEIDYQSWWEQAQALVDLGDGKQSATKSSPAATASRRDRCVSLAQQSPSKRERERTGSEMETEGLVVPRHPPPTAEHRPKYSRRPSAASSFETASVEERQREMLWGVLSPSSKGASLPSRGPPSPRASLALPLEPPPTRPSRPTKFPSAPSPSYDSKPLPGLSVQRLPQRPNGIRRVSKGVSGIKDFLLRLKLKASEEGSSVDHPNPITKWFEDPVGRRSVSSPLRVAAPATTTKSGRTSSSEEEEDWDRQSTPDASPTGGRLGIRRSRTQSTTVKGERMALSKSDLPFR